MVELSYRHIEIIKNEVCNAGISYSHLQYDLIDHICCDIENEMQKGLAFEKAYSEVKQKFSLNGLQKIQEETLLLIDKKYRFMKTTMKIFGIIAPLLIAFGTLFKIEHWPGAGIILVLGFFLLAFVFLPSAVYVSYREVSNGTKKLAHIIGFLAGFLISISFLFKIQHWPGTSYLMFAGVLLVELIFLPILFLNKIKLASSGSQKLMYVLGWVGSFVYLAGFLFKVNHWPGASILLLSGSLVFLVVALPLYVYQKYKDKEQITSSFIFITVAVAWIVLPTMLITLNFSQDAMKGFREIQDKTAYHIQHVTTENNKLYELIQGRAADMNTGIRSESEAVKKMSDEVFDYIGKVKNDIQMASEESGESTGIVNVLFGNNREGEAQKIKGKMENYKKSLLHISGASPAETTLISSLLSTEAPRNASTGYGTWEEYYLKSNNLVSAFANLNNLQDNVRIAENLILKDLLADATRKSSSLVTNHN